MTSQQAQLQALITEIEALLGKAAPRLPWKMTGEATEHRRVMEQALAYLKEQQDAETTPGWDLASAEAGAIAPSTALSADATDLTAADSQPVLQALLQEMQYLRAQMVQPLTQEVMALQQQRETLKHEVRQLELNRLQRAQADTAQPNPAWIDEVVGQLRSSLLAELTPQLRALQAQMDFPPALAGSARDPQEMAADLPQLSPQQRLEQLRQVQAQTDDMLLKLDANLRAVFESLDQSIQSYCDTLNRGLDAMHGLGQQGEFVFRTFINHLAQQFQEETSYFSSQESRVARLRGRDDFEAADEALSDSQEQDYEADDAMASVMDLDDVDLDEFGLDDEVDEEVTLFQLDDEFADLPLDDEDIEDFDADELAAAQEDEDRTVLQTEPIAWEDAIRQGSTNAAAPEQEPSMTAEDETDAYAEQIDSLYASLFGESTDEGESGAIAAHPPATETSEENLDASLFSMPASDLNMTEETPDEGDAEDIGAPVETALGDLFENGDLAAASEVPAEADSPEATPSLETLLGPEMALELSPSETEFTDSDTISSLTELLPATEPGSFQQFADPFAAFDESEDSFIPAPPDEDLLTTDVSEAGTTLDLTLDDETLGQLTSDLSRLEGLSAEDLARSLDVDLREWETEDTPAIVEDSDFSEDFTPETDFPLEAPREGQAPESVTMPLPPEAESGAGEEAALTQDSIDAEMITTFDDLATPNPLAATTEPAIDEVPASEISPESEFASEASEAQPSVSEESVVDEADSLADEAVIAAPESPPTSEEADEDLDVSDLFADEAAIAASDFSPEGLASEETSEALDEEPLELGGPDPFDREPPAGETAPIWQISSAPAASPEELESSVNEFFSLESAADEAPDTGEQERAETEDLSDLNFDELFSDSPEVESPEFSAAGRDELADSLESMTAEADMETAFGGDDPFSAVPPSVNAKETPTAESELAIDPAIAEAGQIDEWLDELEPEPEPPSASLSSAPEAAETDRTDALSLDNIFADTSANLPDEPEAPEAMAEETAGFTLEDAFGSDIDDLANQLGEAPLEDSWATGDRAEMTAAGFDLPSEPPAEPEGMTAEDFGLELESEPESDALTAAGFDLPTEPISFTESELEGADYSLSLEGISLDLEIPDFDETEVSLQQGTVEVESAIADNEPAITLDEGLFPDDRLPDTPVETAASTDMPSDAAETLADWAAFVEAAQSEAAPPRMPNEGAVTPDTLVDELLADDLPEDIPPVQTGGSLETWADAFDPETDSPAEEGLSLDDLDLDFSLDLDDSVASPETPAESPRAATDQTDRLGGLAETADSAWGEEPESRPESREEPLQPGDSDLTLMGSVEEGFAVEPAPDSFDRLLQTLMDAIPEAGGDRPSPPAPSAEGVEASSLPSSNHESQLDIIGSPEAGFELALPRAGVSWPAALAAVPPNPEPVAESPAARMAILGFPAAREWPDSPDNEPLQARFPSELALQGSVEGGFQLAATETEPMPAPLLSVIDELPEPVAADPTLATLTDRAVDIESLQQSYGRRSPTAEAQAGSMTAEELPFNLTTLTLPDIPTYDPNEPIIPARATDASGEAEPAASEAGVSGLAVEGDVAGGYAVALAADAAIAVAIQQLEGFADLPEPPVPNRVPPSSGLLGFVGDRAPSSPESVFPSELVPQTLSLSGSVEAGFSIAELTEPPEIDLLEERLPGLSALADEEPDITGGFWTPEMEEQMAADFAAAEVDSVESLDSETARPLSDDELVDFFPPSPATESATTAAEDNLDTLFEETTEAGAPSALPSVDEASIAATAETSAVEIDQAIAGLMGQDAAAPPASETPSDNADSFADLFPAAEAPPSFEAPPRSAAADEAFPTADRLDTMEPATTDADEASPVTEAEPSLEAMLFEEPSETEPPAVSTDAVNWDPMADDFGVDALDLEADQPEEMAALENLPPAPNLDDIDLSMEEIPETEIENDEAFRTAFEADFDTAGEGADASDLDFDLNDLGDLSELSAAEAEADIPMTLEPDLRSADSPVDREASPAAPAGAPSDEAAPDAEFSEIDAARLAASGMLATLPPVEPDDEDPNREAEAEGPAEEWFLGIDLGTTGLSAVLMERLSGTAHPLCWITDESQGNPQTTFRMPAVAALNRSTEPPAPHWAVSSVGLIALPRSPETAAAGLLTNLKPLLRVGVPHQTTSGTWEPLIQWTDEQTISLQQVSTAVRTLLAQLHHPVDAALHLEAVGLETTALHEALDDLQGVVVGIPTNWSDTYCLNVREAILSAGLVDSPGQIFLLEEAIAAILSGLPDPDDPPMDQNRQVQTLYQCNWQGGTVVISGGAAFTEVGMVDLPTPLDALSREDFKLRNLAYGGDALDLDIICQLLVPAERRQPIAPGDRRTSRGGWSWQATAPEVVNAQWESLQIESMDLPQLAEPDISTRIRLRRHLESSKLGQSLLEAARYLKLILQNQNQYPLELADQTWRVLRRDLESRVLVPYIQRLNQQVNALLSQSGLSSQGINQVICTGGNASFNTIAKWLRQKFPNATIIQDTYPSNRPQTCSRVAYGLANLCRYPQVLDVPRHQYSDYFLLHEIIRIVPETPLPLDGILHMLQEQGINTDVCQSRIEAILEGHLPPGLVSDSATREHLSRSTLDSETYRNLTAGSLFTKQTRQIYMVNPRQRDIIGNHLAAIMLNKQQALTEPLIAELVAL